MLYYNLKIMVLMKKDIKYEQTYQKISNIIFKTMFMEKELKDIYLNNKFKYYNFCSLYLTEKDKVYKKNKIYYFDIRFLDLNFAIKIKHFLSKVYNDLFCVIISSIRVNEYKSIKKLITLTPAIITNEMGGYIIDSDIEKLKKKIIFNTEKKYRLFYGHSLESDFIKDINVINNYPIKIPFREIYLLGNKFEISVKEDYISQKLGFFALSGGILEKNSLGFGFCKAI